jgi:hypothetical protein
MLEPKRPERRKLRGRTRILAGRAVVPPIILLMLLLVSATGQRRRMDGAGGIAPPLRGSIPLEQGPSGGEFTFVRAVYTSPDFAPSYGLAQRGTWAVDFPEADNHFITGIREWAGTNLNVSPRPEHFEIMDERLFDYPFVYIVEPGFMELSDEQAARLREYLLRGGFLFLDDFWGEYEWSNVQAQFKKVLPEYEIKDLPLSHPVFHSYLDIEEIVQVPNIYNAQRGITHEKGGIVPHYMGIEDKNGRLVVFIARNSDLGDAWEWINDSRYPVKYGLAAYKVGINVVIYAMSH